MWERTALADELNFHGSRKVCLLWISHDIQKFGSDTPSLESGANPATNTKILRGRVDCKVKSERPRARRYPLVAIIELTDLQTEIRVVAQISDLNLFGCHVDAKRLLPKETKVRTRIVHAGATFIA